MKKIIEIKGLTKEFNGNIVLKGIDLDIYENEFVTLLGPSGCGKTTLLRILGGFENATNGTILFDQKNLLDIPHTNVLQIQCFNTMHFSRTWTCMIM